MSTVKTDIVTPYGKVFEGEVNMVRARAKSGELGILPKHAPLITPLEIGVVRLKTDTDTQYAAVSGGFLDVRPERVTILAEAAELKHQIDVDRAERAKKRAEEQLQSKENDEKQLLRVELDLKRAINRIDVADK